MPRGFSGIADFAPSQPDHAENSHQPVSEKGGGTNVFRVELSATSVEFSVDSETKVSFTIKQDDFQDELILPEIPGIKWHTKRMSSARTIRIISGQRESSATRTLPISAETLGELTIPSIEFTLKSGSKELCNPLKIKVLPHHEQEENSRPTTSTDKDAGDNAPPQPHSNGAVKLEDSVISFSKFPNMPAPWSSEDKGESWEWGNYIIILQKHPITAREMVIAVSQKKPLDEIKPADVEIRHLYAMTLFYKKGCNPSGMDSARPAMVLTIEQARVSLLYKALGRPIPEGVQCDADGWDPPTFCVFIPTGHINYDLLAGSPSRDNVKKTFFEYLSQTIAGEPRYIGTIYDAKIFKNSTGVGQDNKVKRANEEHSGRLWTYLYWGIFASVIVCFSGLMWWCFSDHGEWFRIEDSTHPNAYSDYLKNNPHGKHRAEAKRKMTELLRDRVEALSKPPFDSMKLKQFVNEFPDYDTEQIEKLFFEDALQNQNIENLRGYLEIFPKGRYADRICKDFSLVSRIDTKNAYQRFIDLCPDAPECATARKRIIDCEVTEISRGHCRVLPRSISNPFIGSNSYGGSATIEVENSTSYTITVRYSGPDSLKFEMAPYQRKTITLSPGNYRVVVTTNEGKITPLYRESDIHAGRYTESFRINQTRTYRRRR